MNLKLRIFIWIKPFSNIHRFNSNQLYPVDFKFLLLISSGFQKQILDQIFGVTWVLSIYYLLTSLKEVYRNWTLERNDFLPTIKPGAQECSLTISIKLGLSWWVWKLFGFSPAVKWNTNRLCYQVLVKFNENDNEGQNTCLHRKLSKNWIGAVSTTMIKNLWTPGTIPCGMNQHNVLEGHVLLSDIKLWGDRFQRIYLCLLLPVTPYSVIHLHFRRN